MPQIALTNGRVFDGEAFLEDHAVILEAGRIDQVVAASTLTADIPRYDLGGALLAPGFIDLQVNGGGGVLFNDEPTKSAVEQIAAAHRRFGTTGMLPTFITDTADKMALALKAINQAMAAAVPGILGIHLEGPFLNPERKGAHAAALIRAFTPADQVIITSLNCRRHLGYPWRGNRPPRHHLRPGRGRRHRRRRTHRLLLRANQRGPGRRSDRLHPPVQRHDPPDQPRPRRCRRRFGSPP